MLKKQIFHLGVGGEQTNESKESENIVFGSIRKPETSVTVHVAGCVNNTLFADPFTPQVVKNMLLEDFREREEFVLLVISPDFFQE